MTTSLRRHNNTDNNYRRNTYKKHRRYKHSQMCVCMRLSDYKFAQEECFQFDFSFNLLYFDAISLLVLHFDTGEVHKARVTMLSHNQCLLQENALFYDMISLSLFRSSFFLVRFNINKFSHQFPSAKITGHHV